MAISLNAEQKNITKIFQNDELFIIPPYQRSYSWEFDECYQLYLDLTNAYDGEEGYFLGNIILAKSNNPQDTNILQIIDGQQRCISLWLMLKVLSILHPDIKKLGRLLAIESWTGESWTPKIKSEIIESDDNDDLKEIYEWTHADLKDQLNRITNAKGEINESKLRSKLFINCLYFYKWFSKIQEADTEYLKGFVKYTIENVYLLPIELLGSDMNTAVNQALTIFETINNRGRDLEDADIFKAMLYNTASKKSRQKEFITSWGEIKERSYSLSLNIDDVFRYYSHIIRGENGIVSNEIKLRKFFVEEDRSPLKTKSFDDVLSDLLKILESLEFYQSEKDNNSELCKWLQIIDAYTNIYPKYAVITYLFLNGVPNEANFINYLKSIIRYVYYRGTTTTVKFEIYNIIHNVSKNKDIDSYFETSISPEYFKNIGRLKKGLALIAHYSLEKSSPLPFYKLDKLISNKNKFLSEPEWEKFDLDSLGNLLISDVVAKNVVIEEKKKYLSKSKVYCQFLDKLNDLSSISLKEFLLKRNNDLENNVRLFFEK